MLTEVYGVSSASVGLYLLPFAVGNLMGPLLLGTTPHTTISAIPAPRAALPPTASIAAPATITHASARP